jgi:hypothetical protein
MNFRVDRRTRTVAFYKLNRTVVHEYSIHAVIIMKISLELAPERASVTRSWSR